MLEHAVFTIYIAEDKLGLDSKAMTELLIDNDSRMHTDPAFTYYEDFLLPSHALIEDLRQSVFERAEGFFNQKYEMENMWLHKQEFNESSNTHNHWPNDLAFVYYVNVPPNSGDLVFLLNDKVGMVGRVTPEPDTLLIFPGWLDHKVTKNHSQETRLSIAGNLIRNTNANNN